jgi:hypothetical protein
MAHGVFAIVIAVLAVIAMATGWTLRRGTVDAVR